MKALHAALASLLASEAAFLADMEALGLGRNGQRVVPKVLLGNRPLQSLGQEHLPAWVIEAADSDASAIGADQDEAGLVIGSDRQGFRAEIPLALVWHQQCPETAFNQRLDLASALNRLLLRNPALGETAELAWLAGTNNDRQALHPTHVAMFRVAVLFTTRRDP